MKEIALKKGPVNLCKQVSSVENQMISTFCARFNTLSLSIKFFHIAGLYNLSDCFWILALQSGGLLDGKRILLLFYNIET